MIIKDPNLPYIFNPFHLTFSQRQPSNNFTADKQTYLKFKHNILNILTHISQQFSDSRRAYQTLSGSRRSYQIFQTQKLFKAFLLIEVMLNFGMNRLNNMYITLGYSFLAKKFPALTCLCVCVCVCEWFK